MRSVPDSFDPDVVAAIDARFDGVERDHGVRVVWAVESGSRAWGFPSPDSDYDARFFYVRPLDDYLSPWRARDVVETPLDAVLDVNGWDLVKAAQLLVRGNATVVEWLQSPIVYRGDTAFRDGLLDLAARVVHRDAVGRHYLHVGRLQTHRHEVDGVLPLKRFFYALRPAAAVAWLRAHPADVIAPMDLATLLSGIDVPEAVRAEIDALVAEKSRTRELGTGTVAPVLRAFVAEQLASDAFGTGPVPDLERRRRDAADGFRRLVREHAPG